MVDPRGAHCPDVLRLLHRPHQLRALRPDLLPLSADRVQTGDEEAAPAVQGRGGGVPRPLLPAQVLRGDVGLHDRVLQQDRRLLGSDIRGKKSFFFVKQNLIFLR